MFLFLLSFKCQIGRKMEVQFLSYARYKASKDGPSAHNLLDNKHVDISPFFELRETFKASKNYETTLKNAIELLDHTTIAEKNRLLATPIEALTPKQRRHRMDIIAAQKNIQIKEYYENQHILLKKGKDGSYYEEKGESHPYTLETYLPIFAQYHSPRLTAISSTHSRVNKNTAFVNIKTLLDNFREILLKGDETTCLADILLKRLQTLQKKDPYITLHQSDMRHILENSGIEEDKINLLLQQMTQQSRNIRLPYTNSISDIKERLEEKENADR